LAEYTNIKLMSGDDIIGVVETEDDETVTINNPIQVFVDPVNGLFAKSYLMFSIENTAVFYRGDIIHISKANDSACEYYDQFVRRIAANKENSMFEEELLQSEEEDIEEMFTSMLEAKSSVKH
jgi:hypothetical protein